LPARRVAQHLAPLECRDFRGDVLVTQGSAAGLFAERYHPATGQGSSASTGSMTTGRESQTATLLPDGQVLMAGGTLFDHPMSSKSSPAPSYTRPSGRTLSAERRDHPGRCGPAGFAAPEPGKRCLSRHQPPFPDLRSGQGPGTLEALRKHASLADLPADEIIPVADTVIVRDDP
jgi:hypothetical protein